MRIIGGAWRGRALASPQEAGIRPTLDRVRENVFNMLSARLPAGFSGMRALDLFAGTGAYGLEALSRGAKAAVFIDNSAQARGLLRRNIENFCSGPAARILRRDACAPGAAGTMAPFHLVFADPPYRRGLGEQAFIAALSGGWLHNNAILVLEEAAGAEVSLPACFVLQEARVYGQAAVRFYALSL